MPAASEDEESAISSRSGRSGRRPRRRGGGGGGGQRLSKVASHTPQEILSGAVAVLAVGSSATGMIMKGVVVGVGGVGIVVYVAGALSAAAGCYSYFQQTKLTDIKALKEAYEAVKREVNRFEGENRRLNEQVGKLSNTMDKLEDVEGALDVITQTQGQSVAAFKEQVADQREMLGDLQKQLRSNRLQNMLQVVIRSDKDDDMQIEEDEIDDLIQRIERINGVEVMRDQFRRKVLDSGGSLSTVMDIINNLMMDESSEGEGIFIIRDDNMT